MIRLSFCWKNSRSVFVLFFFTKRMEDGESDSRRLKERLRSSVTMVTASLSFRYTEVHWEQRHTTSLERMRIMERMSRADHSQMDTKTIYDIWRSCGTICAVPPIHFFSAFSVGWFSLKRVEHIYFNVHCYSMQGLLLACSPTMECYATLNVSALNRYHGYTFRWDAIYCINITW